MRYSAIAFPIFLLVPLTRNKVERSPTVKAEPVCVVAKNWVAEHRWMRPTSLNGFYYLPGAYQKAVYRSLDETQRVRLWREHFAEYTGPASRLSEGQKRFIDSVSARLEYILSRKDLESHLRVFGVAAIHKLGERAAIIVFGQLTAEDPELLNLAGEATRPVRQFVFASYDGNSPGHEELATLLRPAYGATARAMGTCDCHVADDFCNSITGPNESCHPDNRCDQDGFGCGWFWAQSCDGDCVFDG